MDNILKELKEGSTYFLGEEVFQRPPTSKELRAARKIEQLIGVIQGLERQLQTLTAELDEYRSKMQS